MHSCIYEGSVTHVRREPLVHEFRYGMFMVYLDLDELPAIVGGGGLVAGRKLASRSFLRRDHLFEPSRPLADEVRHLVHERTGIAPAGPIRLLTQLRCFGYYFSPLNLFYVFDRGGERVECVLAEVNNTPWNERHAYVLWDGNRACPGDALEFSHGKEFHVSPFMSMDIDYQWKLTRPAENLTVSLASRSKSRRIFEAGMTFRRRALCRSQLRRMSVRYPLMTARISAAIYFQAFKLWWKKCPSYAHPKTLKHSPPHAPASPRDLGARTTTTG